MPTRPFKQCLAPIASATGDNIARIIGIIIRSHPGSRL